MAQSNNIIIGNAGVSGQNSTIMIGDSANQTDTYVAGVYGVSVGATNSPVYIDSTNKLGTMASNIPTDFSTYPFLVYQTGQTPAVLGAGTAYYLGSYIALTKAFDIGTNFNVGAGGGSSGRANGAYFQAPITGQYQFMLNIYVEDQPGPTLKRYLNFESQIETLTNVYEYIETLPGGPSSGYSFPRLNNNFWFTFQCTIQLTLGDKVWFNTNCTTTGTPTNVAKVGDTGYIPAYSTRVSGFRVS